MGLEFVGFRGFRVKGLGYLGLRGFRWFRVKGLGGFRVFGGLRGFSRVQGLGFRGCRV